MSKIHEAMWPVGQTRSADPGDPLAQLLACAAEERDLLRAEIRACQEQLGVLATRLNGSPPIDVRTIDDLACRVAQIEGQHERLAPALGQFSDQALQQLDEEIRRRAAAAVAEQLEAIGAQQQRHHERIDRAAKDLAAAVQDLYSRAEDLGHQTEQARETAQADVASVRQQLAEALHDRDERLGQLAHGVRTAQSEEQLVLAELRQQMAAMEMLHTSSRTELRKLVESANDRAGDACRRLDALSGGLQSQDALLGRILTAQAELKALVQRAEKRLRELAIETVQGGDEQAQRLEALGAALESLRARFADAEVAGRDAAQRWQEELEPLRAAVAESTAAVAAANTRHNEEVRARLDAVDQRLTGAADEQRRLQQWWEAQLAEQCQALRSLSAEAMRAASMYRNESQAGQRELVTRLEAAGEAQAEADRRLRALSGAVQSALTRQVQSAEDIDALRAQVTPLANSQAQLQELADEVGRVRAATDEATRRVGTIDGALGASLAVLRQQIVALQAEEASLHDSAQASLATQQQLTADLDALRAQVASLADAQAQLQQLADGVGRAQVTAEQAARRIAAIDGALAAVYKPT
jgi:chromosome segregation ATPase